MASTLPDEGFPLPAFTNDMTCSASFPYRRGKVGLGFYELARGLTARRTLTLSLKQWPQFQQFSTGSRKLVLQKNLCPTFDVRFCLQKSRIYADNHTSKSIPLTVS